MNWIILSTAIISLIFTGALFERFRNRGSAYHLAWGLGALLYGLAALGEAVNSVVFNELALRTWYLGGAMLTAPWLGQGSIYLLMRKGRVASILGALLVLVSIIALQLVWATPLDIGSGFDPSISLADQYRDILSRDSLTIALTIILNIFGTLALAGGAIFSAYLFWRKRSLLHRAAGNVLIAAGALLPASGGTSVLAGIADWHSLSLLLGVVLLFTGYLVSTPNVKKD
jgi:hypothetical protein